MQIFRHPQPKKKNALASNSNRSGDYTIESRHIHMHTYMLMCTQIRFDIDYEDICHINVYSFFLYYIFWCCLHCISVFINPDDKKKNIFPSRQYQFIHRFHFFHHHFYFKYRFKRRKRYINKKKKFRMNSNGHWIA